MAGLITNEGKKVVLNRTFKSDPDYTAPSQFRIGTGTTNPVISDTDIEYPVPIGTGTVLDDGSNELTGSAGGSNSTDNTTYYKPGAGATDNIGQNLIAVTGSATKTWTRTITTLADSTQYVSLWLYIIDDTALDKFLSSGTCLEVKLGNDASNYYSKTFEATNIQTGWNWIQLGVLGDNTETGTVSGDIDWFRIDITTNNTTDTFAAGDVVFDLLRMWEDTDTFKDYKSVTITETSLTVSTVCELLSGEAVGYDVSEIGTYNADATPKMSGRDTFTAKSKSSAEEFKFTIVNGVE